MRKLPNFASYLSNKTLNDNMKHLYYFYPVQLKNFTDPSEVESNLVTFLK